MDNLASAPPEHHAEAPPSTPFVDPKLTELMLEALKTALNQEGEHRLFRAGKLPGLFATKTGLAGQAATQALASGLLEAVRSEIKAKTVTEWVRVTPAGVRFLQEHDSPKSVLCELRDLLQLSRAGVPVFLDDARRSVAELTERFEQQSAELVKRLDMLTERVEAALRRADSTHATSASAVVPWAEAALRHLDQRRAIGAGVSCPLGELFHAVREVDPALTLLAFHDGLRRMVDNRAIQLSGAGAETELVDPEYAMICGAQVCCYASR